VEFEISGYQKAGERAGEIVGYRDALATIHPSAQDIPLTDGVVLALHRAMMRYGILQGGV
jgi:hypothetical protein